MKIQDVLRTEIPKSMTSRALVLIFAVVSFLCIYGVAAMTTYPQTSGETSGEAAMTRGAFFFTFGPFAAAAALLTMALTMHLKCNLSRLWIGIGLGPALSLVPAVIYILWRFGAH